MAYTQTSEHPHIRNLTNTNIKHTKYQKIIIKGDSNKGKLKKNNRNKWNRNAILIPSWFNHKHVVVYGLVFIWLIAIINCVTVFTAMLHLNDGLNIAIIRISKVIAVKIFVNTY